MYKAIIEMPKGDSRRRHMSYTKNGFIDLGPIKDVIPINGGIMPIHYGYIENTLNKKEGDEVDVLIFSEREFSVGDKIAIIPIALLRRDDGDDKIVAVEEGDANIKSWEDVPEKEKKVIISFFGHHHEITSVENKKKTTEYIKKSLVNQ